MIKGKVNIGRYLLLAFISISIFAFYFFQQPVITYPKCDLCDGNHYLAMYQYLEGTASEYSAPFPFYSRILVPLMASVLPVNDPLCGFQIINLIFSVLGMLALYYLWHRFNIPWYLILIAFLWLLFHWTGMIRLNSFDPVTVDLPLYLLQVLLIYIFLNQKYNWLYVIAPLAVLQKESIMVFLLVFFLFALWNNRRFPDTKIPLLPLAGAIGLAILTKFLFTQFYPPLKPGYSSVRLGLFYLKEMWMDPFKIVRWTIAIFTAYGFFLLLALLNLNRSALFNRTFSFLTIMSVTSIFLSIIGDHTRIAFLGFPFVMTWILLSINDLNWKWITGAFLFSLPLMRIFEKIPDPGQEFSTFAMWYPEYAPATIVTGFAGYLALMSLVLVAIYFTVKEKK